MDIWYIIVIAAVGIVGMISSIIFVSLSAYKVGYSDGECNKELEIDNYLWEKGERLDEEQRPMVANWYTAVGTLIYKKDTL